jgi:hypothetical protein
MENFAQRQLVAWQTRMTCSWMVKLTPDIEGDMANKLLEEASNISLDGATPDQEEESPTSKAKPKVSSKLPTKQDFYDMSDDEIEKYLGTGENSEGSFESLRAGLGKRLSRHIN